jgi:hypothetical protein
MDVAQNRSADSAIVLDRWLSRHVQRQSFDSLVVHATVRRIYDA